FYDGHPGYDYKASCGTPVYAAASGTASYPTSIPGANGKTFHILELDPDAAPDYKIYYLHLSNYVTSYCPKCTCPHIPNVVASGMHIKAGDLIGFSGDAGVPGQPHLHFEVQKLGLQSNPKGVPVDPYGWKGGVLDPYK